MSLPILSVGRILKSKSLLSDCFPSAIMVLWFLGVLPSAIALPAGFSPASSDTIPEIHPAELPCQDEPSGLGLPGFQPGTPKSRIQQTIGAPAQTQPGYWGNTTASIYHLIPNRVSLGFLFDNKSNLLQQSEASFANTVDTSIILSVLDSMLGCRLNAEIQQGFDRVWTGQSSQYSFEQSNLEGTIFWESDTRVYIGIWQQGFQ